MLLREHGEEMVADFYRFYEKSPRSHLLDGTPMSDVAAMAAHLPPDSATMRAIDPDHMWSPEAQLCAAAVDEIREMQWLLLKRWGQKAVKRPDPIPRPGVQPNQDVDVVGANAGFDSWDDMAAWYAELNLTPSGADPTPRSAPTERPRDARGRFVKTAA